MTTTLAMFHSIASRSLLSLLLSFFAPSARGQTAEPTQPDPSRYFAIRVVDSKTNRGVPLVELKTVSNVRYWTDSNGYVAIDDPALLNRTVFFFVESHGYRFPKDGFGSAGRALDAKPRTTAELKIDRINIAERLYRVTGEGIYLDSYLLNKPVPIEKPLINSQVTGQDSVQSVLYRDKVYYFWGDTGRQRYPLGNFSTTGATSPLPGKGTDPSKGINLTYFENEEGFTRAMAKVPGKGLIWIDNVMVLKDDSGKDRMVAHYALMKDLPTRLAHGMIAWNDDTQTFDHWLDFPNDTPMPTGHALRVATKDGDYFYLTSVYAMARVKADWKSIQDYKAYESWTCLKPGTRFTASKDSVERDDAGKPVWAYKRATDFIDEKRQKELVDAGAITPAERWYDVKDVESGNPVTFHGGTIAWNDYRKKYVAVALQVLGKPSNLGEVWYSESDAPEGPFRKARRIITHDKYSFYNPRHHPFFDEQGGKIIYFEGTYSGTFSRDNDFTPRYDYNQIMYRLDLSDERLKLDR